MGNEIVGVGALEHEHLDGVVGLGSLNEGDQIADQFGSQKIHGRGRDFREQNGPFLAHLERLENHGAVVGCARRESVDDVRVRLAIHRTTVELP